jgi:nitrogen fixation/metabolism regulation signal transduction histidine kinase
MAGQQQGSAKPPFSLIRWTRKIGLGPKTSFFVAMLAILSGIATYKSLTIDNPTYTRILLIADVVIVVILAVIITHRLIRTWRKGQMGGSGSMMHRRILRLFSLIAVAPALMVALFSALFFNIYFQKHFSDPVNMAVSESIGVANAYIKEHIQNIQSDALAMAAQINRAPTQVLESRILFENYLSDQVVARNLRRLLPSRNSVLRWSLTRSNRNPSMTRVNGKLSSPPMRKTTRCGRLSDWTGCWMGSCMWGGISSRGSWLIWSAPGRRRRSMRR